MRQNKSIHYRLLSALCFVLAFMICGPLRVEAAGQIDPNRDGKLTVIFNDGTTPVAGAEFDIYRVADTDEYGRMTVNSDFAGYPIPSEGMVQAEWMEYALTLKGYASRDQIEPAATEVIGPDGTFSTVLKPGLYLLSGNKTDVGDYAYTPTPFMVFLPGSDLDNNTWEYDVCTNVKFTKEEIPRVVTRKALKIWDDEGFETLRPQAVTVDLLCDGEIYDTQELSEDNEWQYTWNDLPEENEWLVVEKEVKGYYTKVSLEGITFTVNNKYIIPLTAEDITVVKKIVGDTPGTPAEFTFVFKAEKDDSPMPAGSNGNVKQITVNGAGNSKIGKITFKEPGTYIYTLTEKNTGEKGYIYDKKTYTITYTVTQEENQLFVERKITGDEKEEVDTPVFTNRYTKGSILPQTGVLWWPVLMLLLAGLLFCIIGVLKKRNE